MPEDALYERGEVSHAINLFDMSQKYADVLTTDEVVSFLEGLPASGEAVAEGSKA